MATRVAAAAESKKGEREKVAASWLCVSRSAVCVFSVSSSIHVLSLYSPQSLCIHSVCHKRTHSKKAMACKKTEDGTKIMSPHSLAMHALDLLYKEPQNYKEAIASSHRHQWKEGMDKEIASLRKTTHGHLY